MGSVRLCDEPQSQARWNALQQAASKETSEYAFVDQQLKNWLLSRYTIIRHSHGLAQSTPRVI